MSLKSFHIVFISICFLFALFFASWCYGEWKSSGLGGYFAGSVGSGLVAIALPIYGRYFLRKLKDISYL